MKVDWWNAYEIESHVAEVIAQQQINGWKFDVEKAEWAENFLTDEMSNIYDEVRPNLRKILSKPYNTPMNKPFLKSGEYSTHCKKWYEDENELERVSGPFTRINWDEPNLGSDKQVKELLIELGWQPTEWNYKKKPNGRKMYDESGQPVKTSPKLTEESFDSIQIGIGPRIAEYLKAKHRRSSIQGYLSNTDENGFIHAQANHLGTPTGRFTHKIVVNVPKPKDYVYFGKEMRSLFSHREGYKLVGHDFSGLEARIMAHYLDDPELTAKLIFGSSSDGTDFHSYFWEPLKDFVSSRDNAKNVEYAYIFGAMDPKLGNMADTKPKGWSDEKTGKAMRQIIAKSIPALGELTRNVQEVAKRRGFIIGLDGRKIFTRSVHSALNYLFQSGGAVVFKTSLCLLDDYINENKLGSLLVGNFHDECQYDVPISDIELHKELAVKACRESGLIYDLNCPMDAEAEVGNNWAETH